MLHAQAVPSVSAARLGTRPAWTELCALPAPAAVLLPWYSMSANTTDQVNSTTITLADILQGQPERPAAGYPPTAPPGDPAAAPGSPASAGDKPILPIVLPVVLGVAVVAAAALLGFKVSHMRRAARVVAAPAPARGLSARAMMGESVL
jgi:hypothetical protein